MKLNYIVIPLLAVAVSVLGGFATSSGIESGWYETLQRSPLTPENWVFGPVWTTIYILTTLSVLIMWNHFRHAKHFQFIMFLFCTNAILNVLWSWLFFGFQMTFAAYLEMFVLNATTILLFILIWHLSRLAAILLIPYIGWVSFATYLAYYITANNA
jgi:benzodiazapine receptor